MRAKPFVLCCRVSEDVKDAFDKKIASQGKIQQKALYDLVMNYLDEGK